VEIKIGTEKQIYDYCVPSPLGEKERHDKQKEQKSICQ
jgi:hypothetical protein